MGERYFALRPTAEIFYSFSAKDDAKGGGEDAEEIGNWWGGLLRSNLIFSLLVVVEEGSPDRGPFSICHQEPIYVNEPE
jgi:hypothetical protein